MEASEDNFHCVEVEDDVLLGKLLVVPDHIQQHLVFAHASQNFLIDSKGGLVGTVLFPLFFDQALDSASK